MPAPQSPWPPLGLRPPKVSGSNVLATVIWAAALYGEGAMTIRAWTLSAIAVPPVVIGLAVGIRLRGRIREDMFRSAVYIFLIVLSANVVRKGFI